MVRSAFKNAKPATKTGMIRRSRDEVLTAWYLYTRLDWKCREIADHLGMSYKALDRAITRARVIGDPRAIYRRGYGPRTSR